MRLPGVFVSSSSCENIIRKSDDNFIGVTKPELIGDNRIFGHFDFIIKQSTFLDRLEIPRHENVTSRTHNPLLLDAIARLEMSRTEVHFMDSFEQTDGDGKW